MIPYLKSVGNNSVNCNCDLIVLDDSKIVMASLIDYGIITKKIASDFLLKKNNLILMDRENVNFKRDLYLWGNTFNYKSDKQGNLTHTFIKNKNIDEYMIDWNKDGLLKLTINFIRNKMYLPITETILHEIEYEKLINEMEVHTNNPLFKDLKVYKLNKHSLKWKLENYKSNSSLDCNFNWGEIETIQDYIYKFLEPIRNKVVKTVDVLYDKDNITESIFDGIKPMKGQIPVIQGGIEVLKRDKFVYIGAEQGFGKTLVASKINNSYMNVANKSSYNTLIIAPAITLTQWRDEIKKAFSTNVDIHIIKKTEDFIKLYNNKPEIPTYYIIGKETFKLSYAMKPSFNKRYGIVEKRELDDYYKTRYIPCSARDYMFTTKKVKQELLTCPSCGIPLKNNNRKTEDVYFTENDFKKPNKSNYKCSCGSVLWSATYNKTKKTSVIDYIHRKGIIFDSVIVDEAHEGNNSGSIIGNATRTILRNHCKKAICLSGTSNNGYASSLFNIFMALLPNKLKSDDCLDVKDFVQKYGTLMAVTNVDDERRSYHNRGKAEIKDSDFKEIEGVNPIVFLKYLSQNYIFATLDDVKDNLPDIKTNYIPIAPLDSQRINSNNLFNEIKKANNFNAKMYIDSIIKHYINNPVEWNPIEISYGDEKRSVLPRNLQIKNNLPKEDKVIEIAMNEYKEGRKVWIYCEFNNGGQYMQGETIPRRLKRILEEKGLKVFLLTTSTSTYDRKDIIEKNKDKHDVFICNPRLVNVGINLVFCPTYIFFMPSYRVDIYSQAERRGYRANSTLENRIYHLYYKDTFEEEIIERYQRKLAESNAINGRFDVVLEDKEIRTASSFSSTLS